MPLIESPRHTVADLAHWRAMEVFDAALARSAELERLEARALETLRAFAAAGPCYVGTSWGKDSTVVAHLAWRAGVGPIVWFPAGKIENPDCVLVRDAFLARFPCEYHEVDASEAVPRAFHPDAKGEAASVVAGHDGYQDAFERASRRFGRRYVSGVRAEESGIRRLRMRMDGEISTNTCRPIGWWKAEHVFAYLAKHDLPIHPAYAMTMGGVLDRRKIRVSTIGGERGRAFGRREWEARYYPEVLAIAEGAHA